MICTLASWTQYNSYVLWPARCLTILLLCQRTNIKTSLSSPWWAGDINHGLWMAFGLVCHKFYMSVFNPSWSDVFVCSLDILAVQLVTHRIELNPQTIYVRHSRWCLLVLYQSTRPVKTKWHVSVENIIKQNTWLKAEHHECIAHCICKKCCWCALISMLQTFKNVQFLYMDINCHYA